MMKFLTVFGIFLSASALKFNANHFGPTIMQPRRGDYIDLTAKPYTVDSHQRDGELILDTDKVLSNFVILVDMERLNNQATDVTGRY